MDRYIIENFIDIGLSPDYSRIWENRMCFRKNKYDVVYHIPTNIVIIKKMTYKKKLYPSKVIYNKFLTNINNINQIINEDSNSSY